MADVMPDYHVEIQKIRMNISQLETQKERAKLEIMQIVSQRRKAVENIKATDVSLIEYRATLKGLIEEHGEPPPLEELE